MKYELSLPSYFGKEVIKRLKTLKVDTQYTGYTLDNDLNIKVCEDCKIVIRDDWTPHNNDVIKQVRLTVDKTYQWWTLDRKVIEEIQAGHISKQITLLKSEVERLLNLNDPKCVITHKINENDKCRSMAYPKEDNK